MAVYTKVNESPSIVWINEQGIDIRIDADYYRVSHIEKSKSNNTLRKISEYCTLSKNRFNPKKYDKDKFKYIDISNIDIVSGVFEYQIVDKNEAPSRARKKVNKDDIIVSTVRPNRNAVSLINIDDTELVASTGFAVLKCKKSIDNYYLFAVLKTNNSIEQLVRKTSGGLYPAISEQDVMDIEIPVPSAEIQKYIGDKIKKAEELREEAKKLKTEAFELLSSELNNNKTDRFNMKKEYIFVNDKPNILYISEELIDTTRVEAMFYKKEDLEIDSKLVEYKHGYKFLKDICIKITDGTHKTPNYKDEGVTFISSKNILEDEIDFENVKYISQDEHKEISKRCNVESGDILFTKIGRIGYAKVVPNVKEHFSIFVSVALLKLKKEVDGYFLETFLNSEYGKKQSIRLCKGSNQPDFHLEDIGELKIPILPMEVQKEIGDKIRKIEDLKYNIRILIQQAKQDIEDLIEGNFDMSKIKETN